MPLSGTPAPPNKRKKPSKIITDLSHITQDAEDEADAEATEFDLGTKIKAPKDLMLEELSLLKNKGSKMFKMRQQRVERFIYENNPDLLNESMQNLQNLVPSLGGQVTDGAPNDPNAPISETNGDGVDPAQEKEKKRHEYVKTYISPWERAMKGDTELTATMKLKMPGPHVFQELPKYKSFNRTALPFGGFEKASQLMTFQMPDLDVAPEELEPAVVYHLDINSRPSFNRTPIPWVCTSEHSDVLMEHLDTIPFDGETDDL
ncbi:myozenin-1-like [Megalops cyprinoides]|uniref:myozenin-1-like n=1 Tax=Megalops cyprinoides TaxID=118141 RepID=UPI00186524A6|nr:myozenin-1-like [Megalops cyprinoides]